MVAEPVELPRRWRCRFMLAHPARPVALGFGSAWPPKAPGTVGTLWAWLAWLVLSLAEPATAVWGAESALARGRLVGLTVTADHRRAGSRQHRRDEGGGVRLVL